MALEPPKKRPATPGSQEARPAEGPVLRQADEAVATILAREAYTRERHYFLVRVIIALSLALVVMSAAVLFMATRPPVNHFFATDKDGRIMALTPIDKPIGSLADLESWVASSVVKAYTMDFANYRVSQDEAQRNFTAPGWRGFKNAMDSSGFLQTVVDKKYVTTAVPTSAPVKLDEGLVDGRYAWKLQMPLLVTFQSQTGNQSQNLMVDIIVVREPETQNPRGLGIAQLIAQ
jgi:intracellular multiplication protein IcmL